MFLPGLAFESLLPWSSTPTSWLHHHTFFLGVTSVSPLAPVCCLHPALLVCSEKPFYVLATHSALVSSSRLLQHPTPNWSTAYITCKLLVTCRFLFSVSHPQHYWHFRAKLSSVMGLCPGSFTSLTSMSVATYPLLWKWKMSELPWYIMPSGWEPLLDCEFCKGRTCVFIIFVIPQASVQHRNDSIFYSPIKLKLCY